MRRLYFKLTLEEPAVLDAGGDAPLDHIPGAALLGAVASRVYTAAGPLAWSMFHSGEVRFHDARPLAANGPAWVVPLSLHAPKGATLKDLQEAGWDDFATGHHQTGHKPLHNRQIYPSGRLAEVHRGFQLKTAVDFESERAAESQLFGYATLLPYFTDRKARRRPAVFGFNVDLDLVGEVLREAEALLKRAFAAPIAVGRSRSAEFGRARVEAADEWAAVPTEAPEGGEVQLVLLSDTCLVDERGQATTRPEPAHFGLDEGELVAERTFARTRSWTPFNGHRRRPDLTRHALAAGSVITFTLPRGFDLRSCQAKLVEGIGAHRAEGLGQVAVQPKLLRRGSAGLLSAEQAQPTRAVAKHPGGTLGDWLKAQAGVASLDLDAWKLAQDLLKEMAMKRCLRGGSKRPSPSQWRRVQRAAQSAQGDVTTLQAALFDASRGVCAHGKSEQLWFPKGAELDDERHPGAFLRATLQRQEAGARATCRAVAYLAKEVARGIKQKDEKEGDR